jgi:YVTN family beta-propeller protein
MKRKCVVFTLAALVLTSGSIVAYAQNIKRIPLGARINLAQGEHSQGFNDGVEESYVANIHPSTMAVRVIDNRNYSVTGTIDMDPPDTDGPLGIAVTPDQTRIYVTDLRSGTVQVIDSNSKTEVARVNLCHAPPCDSPVKSLGPFGIAILPDGTKAFVALNGNPGNSNNEVVVIDTDPSSSTYNLEIAVITLPDSGSVKNGPTWVAVAPDGSTIYVSSRYDGVVESTVSYIASSTYEVLATHSTGGSGVLVLSINASGTELWIANQISNTVVRQEVSTGTNTILRGFSRPKSTLVLEDQVYVTNFGTVFSGCGESGPPSPIAGTPNCTNEGASVQVIDTETNEIVVTIPMEPGSLCGQDGAQACARVGPFMLAVSDSLDKIVVGGWDNKTVSYIDTASNTVVATVGVGNRPFGIAQVLKNKN